MEDTMKFSKEFLDLFYEKSKYLVPRCFGAYDKEDVVCIEYCARKNRNLFEGKINEIRRKLNEPGGLGSNIFYNDWSKSCEEERNKLDSDIKKTQETLKRCIEVRQDRDRYFLSEDSKGIGRIPVGEIKTDRAFTDFAKQRHTLFLQTKDTRLFVHPYGPMYDNAEGKIYKLIPGGAAPFDAVGDLAYVKRIQPKVPERYSYPIKVNKQYVEHGYLILDVEVHYREQGSWKQGIDIHQVNNTKLKITLYPNSAKEFVRVDDIGILPWRGR